jgi:hypothetical protein
MYRFTCRLTGSTSCTWILVYPCAWSSSSSALFGLFSSTLPSSSYRPFPPTSKWMPYRHVFLITSFGIQVQNGGLMGIKLGSRVWRLHLRTSVVDPDSDPQGSGTFAGSVTRGFRIRVHIRKWM